jgi:hypothetical protein
VYYIELLLLLINLICFIMGLICLCSCDSDQEQFYIALVYAFMFLSMIGSKLVFMFMLYSDVFHSLSSVAMRNWGNEYVCM